MAGGGHTVVAQAVPGPPGAPRAAMHDAGVWSVHVPSAWQHASAGGHGEVAQSEPVPPGVPPLVWHVPGSSIVQVPSAWQHACGGQGAAAHVEPVP